MKELFDLLDYQDFLSLVIALALLCYLSQLFAGSEAAIHRWGYRIAAAAMLVHAAYLIDDWRPTTAAALVSITIRAAFTGGFALAIGRIVLSAGVALYRLAAKPLGERWRAARAEHRLAADRRRDDQRQAEARRQAQEDWERRAPERERTRQETDTRAARQQVDRRRREQVRLDCELFYAAHAADIGGRFSQAQFDQFVARYMRDDLSPKEVEARGRQLQEIIRQQVEKIEPTKPIRTMADLTAWLEGQKKEIEAVGNPEERAMYLAILKATYAEKATQLLEEIEP